jgi:hypothetical protein
MRTWEVSSPFPAGEREAARYLPRQLLINCEPFTSTAAAIPMFQLNADTTAFLGGVEPLSLWGSDAIITGALYLTGLGNKQCSGRSASHSGHL